MLGKGVAEGIGMTDCRPDHKGRRPGFVGYPPKQLLTLGAAPSSRP